MISSDFATEMKRSRVFFVVLIFAFILLFTVTIYYTNVDVVSNFSNEEVVEDESVIWNIEKIKKSGEKGFFVETQNTTEHKLITRQACSIESAGMYSAILSN